MVELERLWENAKVKLKDIEWHKRNWERTKKFFQLFYYKIDKERVPREAGALAYATILGFIPFITFLVMISPDLPFLDVKGQLAEFLGKNFIPGSAEAVMDVVNEMISRRMGPGVVAFVILFISSFLLFDNIRRTFDSILLSRRVSQKGIGMMIVQAIGTIFFGIILMVLLFSISSMPLISHLFKLKIFMLLSYFLPIILQFLLLFFLYLFMPSIKVKKSSLLIGAFCSTVLWVILKGVFDYYIYNMTSYQKVYGVFSALPIFLLWIYINWIIVLGGVVLVSVIDKDVRNEMQNSAPLQRVKLTMELYGDDKLMKQVEEFLDKNKIKDLVESIDEESEL